MNIFSFYWKEWRNETKIYKSNIYYFVQNWLANRFSSDEYLRHSSSLGKLVTGAVKPNSVVENLIEFILDGK
jgi:hypothetical protein